MANVMALPSKGRIGAILARRLPKLGLCYANSSLRSYCNSFVGYPNVAVRLMPANAVAKALTNGEVDFGLTGLDLVSELSANASVTLAAHCRYALAQADVSVLVPKCWVDFNCLSDLRVLSLIKGIRVATKYVNLTEKFFEVNQLTFLEVLRSEGATELEPSVGKSDFVVDIVSTGGTVRDNALKRLDGGTVLRSSLCLFYNIKRTLCAEALEIAHVLARLPAL
ncbi:MAG: ATP phosphoribosyltransferase [Candidatus Hodgkinia cicadicola]